MTKITRCSWANYQNDPLYQKYHDEEWAVKIYDDRKLFEILTLESCQAGLSWLTILRKRENYRKAFDNFNISKIARYNKAKINELMNNKGIIRYLPKIEAAVNNAQKFIKIQEEFGSFSNFQWSFVNFKQIKNNFKKLEEIPSETKISKKFYKELKSRGFKFLGPVTCYAHMQACGMVDDHLQYCFKCYK